MVALAEFIDELGRTALDLMQFSDKEAWYYTIGCILGNPKRANVHCDGPGMAVVGSRVSHVE